MNHPRLWALGLGLAGVVALDALRRGHAPPATAPSLHPAALRVVEVAIDVEADPAVLRALAQRLAAAGHAAHAERVARAAAARDLGGRT